MSCIVPIAACIIKKDGKIVFIRRTKPPFEGLLSLPGGKIEFGETIEDTATREMKEETDISSRFVRYLATVPEHIIENGRIVAHFLIHLCELEYIKSGDDREFEPVWIRMNEVENFRDKMTPSDYLMIKRILFSEKPKSHYSLIEKSGNEYIQKEFREL